MREITDIQQFDDLLPVGLKSFLFLCLALNCITTLGLSEVDVLLLEDVPNTVNRAGVQVFYLFVNFLYSGLNLVAKSVQLI